MLGNGVIEDIRDIVVVDIHRSTGPGAGMWHRRSVQFNESC